MAKKPLKLLPAEHARMVYSHAPEAGFDPAGLIEPGYWANVAKDLRVGDEIIVVPEDGAWRAHLFVRAIGKIEALVQCLSLVVLGEEVEDAAGAYAVKFRGRAKWSVVVDASGEVLKDGLATKEDAAAWMTQHTNAMAA